MLLKHETTHRGACKSCPFNCSQDMSTEDYLPLRSSALFPSKTRFCPSKAIIETKLLIILICGVFVYWSSAGAHDDHTHFPLCKSHFHAVMQSRGMWMILRCPVLVGERMINTICNHTYQCNQRNSSKLHIMDAEENMGNPKKKLNLLLQLFSLDITSNRSVQPNQYPKQKIKVSQKATGYKHTESCKTAETQSHRDSLKRWRTFPGAHQDSAKSILMSHPGGHKRVQMRISRAQGLGHPGRAQRSRVGAV